MRFSPMVGALAAMTLAPLVAADFYVVVGVDSDAPNCVGDAGW